MEKFKAGLLGWVAILACYFLGEFIVLCFGISLPGALVGLLLLLIALIARQRPLYRLNTAAQPLLRHMSILFVPAILGAFFYLDTLLNYGLAIALAVGASTLIAMGGTAWISQTLLIKWRKHDL